ncbi:hypothetical protein ACI79D_14785 [Geodermatophilus sp. SYSU D00708]
MPLYDVQALLGRESPQITARYSHLQPDAHGAVEAAWRRMLERRRRPDAADG